MNAIEGRIAEILASHFKIDPGVVDSDVTFAELRFDSLVLVELGLVLDKEFGIAIDDNELAEEMTIADAADLVAAKGAVL